MLYYPQGTGSGGSDGFSSDPGYLSPFQIPGLISWLKSDNPANTEVSNVVTTAADLSGNSNNFTNTHPSRAGFGVAADPITGRKQWNITNSTALRKDGILNGLSEFTVFGVFKCNTDSIAIPVRLSGTGTPANACIAMPAGYNNDSSGPAFAADAIDGVVSADRPGTRFLGPVGQWFFWAASFRKRNATLSIGTRCVIYCNGHFRRFGKAITGSSPYPAATHYKPEPFYHPNFGNSVFSTTSADDGCRDLPDLGTLQNDLSFGDKGLWTNGSTQATSNVSCLEYGVYNRALTDMELAMLAGGAGEYIDGTGKKVNAVTYFPDVSIAGAGDSLSVQNWPGNLTNSILQAYPLSTGLCQYEICGLGGTKTAENAGRILLSHGLGEVSGRKRAKVRIGTIMTLTNDSSTINLAGTIPALINCINAFNAYKQLDYILINTLYAVGTGGTPATITCDLHRDRNIAIRAFCANPAAYGLYTTTKLVCVDSAEFVWPGDSYGARLSPATPTSSINAANTGPFASVNVFGDDLHPSGRGNNTSNPLGWYGSDIPLEAHRRALNVCLREKGLTPFPQFTYDTSNYGAGF